MVLDLSRSAVAVLDNCLALEDQRRGLVGVEFIEAGLEQLRGDAAVENLKRVLRVELVDFQSYAPVIDFNLRWSNVGGYHFDGAVVVEAEKNAWRKQDFRLACLC